MSAKKKPHTHAAARVIESNLSDREEDALFRLFQAFGLVATVQDLDEVPNIAVTIIDRWAQNPHRIHNLENLFKRGILRNIRTLREENGLGFQIALELLTQFETRLRTRPGLTRFSGFISEIKPVTDQKVQPSEQVANA